MIKHINFSEFCDSFGNSYKNNFSYEGKRALFDYLEQYSDDTGQQVELDTVALCCEYTEYDSFEDLQDSYPNIKNMEELQDNAQMIPIEGTERFIIQNY